MPLAEEYRSQYGTFLRLPQALAMGKKVLIPRHPSNIFFEQFSNAIMYDDPMELVPLLREALASEPTPMSPMEQYRLSWDAASERLLDAAALPMGTQRTKEEPTSTLAYYTHYLMGVQASCQAKPLLDASAACQTSATRVPDECRRAHHLSSNAFRAQISPPSPPILRAARLRRLPLRHGRAARAAVVEAALALAHVRPPRGRPHAPSRRPLGAALTSLSERCHVETILLWRARGESAPLHRRANRPTRRARGNCRVGTHDSMHTGESEASP